MRPYFKQDYLYSRKSEFLVMDAFEKKSCRELGKLFNASKSTVSEFQRSARYQAFKSLILGDPVKEHIIKNYENWEEIQLLNSITEVQVLKEIHD